MGKSKQLECRVVITNKVGSFELGMYDPINARYERLGTHPMRDKDRIVRDLKNRIEMEGHLVSFSELTGDNVR